MTGPIVAIVGRANVGKSTLLNRLSGRQVAVTADFPGTTRDRVFASVSWQGRELTVIDTGGWQAEPQSSLERKVRKQVEAAVTQADVIIFLTDVKDGVIAGDEEIADLLRATDKPVVLAANKVDSAKQANQVPDFYRLGMGEPVAISAHHNLGIDDLMDAVSASLPAGSTSIAGSGQARFAIVGRPNVGKSTLLNTLLGDERAIVDESPGTTRDSLDAMIHWSGRDILLVDTAGIKRRGRVGAGVDYYSLLRSLQAINRCDVALLLTDATEFITAQDMHILGYVIESGRGIILLVNKWDLISREKRQRFKRGVERRLEFASYVPVIYISAKLGQGVKRILPQAWEVWEERQKRLSESEISELVEEAVSSHPPPRMGSRQLRVVRAYQEETRPACFVVTVNDPKLVHFSYQRYLGNRLREGFGFRGVPVTLIFAKSGHRARKKTEVRAS
jgi:GTP-binding protein